MRLILFDCDGTLVDSQHMIVAAMDRAFAANNLTPPPRHETLAIVGRSLYEAMADLTDGEGPLDDLVAAYKASFFELRADPAFHEPLYDGAETCLRALARRDDVLLGVATGKSRRGLDAVLTLHGLTDMFVTLQTSDHVPSKPHPAMVEKALAETGASAAGAVMIGDTSHDMRMAQNAGIVGLGVSWGYHPVDELQAHGAQHIFDDYAALQTHLLDLP